jgi:hypothetical protein
MDDIKQQAASVTSETDETVGTNVEELAGSSRPTGGESVQGAPRATNAIADYAAVQLADYVRGATKQIDALADDLQNKKVGDLLASAVEYGRTHPVMMLAGAAFVGFALSRLTKAGGGQSGQECLLGQ